MDAADEIPDRWEASPIRRAAPRLVDQLADAGNDGGLLALVTDEAGRVLWESAPDDLKRPAEGVGLIPGGRWDEGAAGTNGIGLALVTGLPSAVFATEHWCEPVRDWVCYSAPVRAPDGAITGIIDLSTTWDRANSLGLRTVGALARLMEVELAGSWRPSGIAGLDIQVLGRSRATLDGSPVALTRRQLELIVTLALVGAATLDELHALLFGDRPISRSTLRAEISHLRSLLGGAIASRPYRLTVPCRLDVADVLDRLGQSDVGGAVERYEGSLLPASEAPLIVERRYHVDVALRTALLLGGTTSQLLRYAAVHRSDLEVLQQAVAIAEPGDPDLPVAVAALAVADADLAL
ncbi:MAG: transcriptional regulator [Ilumatobacteraceae bacterium]